MALAALALALLLPGAAAVLERPAGASVFNLPHFVQNGDWAIGAEPELTLSSGAGLAGTLKFTQGISDLSNLQLALGTGGGPRRFRIGGAMTFDFFPDIPGQPGIGVAAQTMYYRLAGDTGRLEATAIPYLHKTFLSGKNEIEPYFSVPFGFGFSSGSYKALVNVAVGSMFRNSERLRYNLELGIAVNNTESYMAGGVTYYH